ncbi:MAG: hypothetical protein IJ946_02855 [Clostridia bacterium]|nr:hypothetical protein [Clostridia bacterium]
MRFIFNVIVVFAFSLLLIFTLAACGNKTEDGGNSSVPSEAPSSSVTSGSTDDDNALDADDIFGTDSSSSSSSDGSDASDGSESSDSSNSSDTSSDASDASSGDQQDNNSSGIDYDDPSIWTDPV